MLNLYFNTSPNGAATIGAYSALDLGLGTNSDLRVDVVAFTHNNIDISNFDLLRPFS